MKFHLVLLIIFLAQMPFLILSAPSRSKLKSKPLDQAQNGFNKGVDEGVKQGTKVCTAGAKVVKMKDGDLMCDIAASAMGEEAKNTANAFKGCAEGKNCQEEIQKDLNGKKELIGTAREMMKKS